MKKNTVKALAALFLASFAFLVTACKTEVADTMPPAKVTDVNATAANGKAVITWTNPADEDFYATRITVAPKVENGNSSLVIEGSANEKSSASFDGLTNGTEYTFSLYAIDKSLNVSEAVEVKATPQDTSDKTAPAEVTELKIEAADGEATLTWVNPEDSDFAGVKITMTPAEGSLENAVILEKGVTKFDVSGLAIDEEYSFTIQTFDESLNYSEGASQTAIVADTSDTEAPEDVTDLTVQAANGNAVLTWKNPTDSDFAGVKITMTPAAGTLKNAVRLEKTVTSFSVSGLTIGEEYSFTIQTFDASLNYSVGATQKATVADTSDKIAPAEVTELKIEAADGNAKLTWVNPEDSDFAGVKISMSPATGTLENEVILTGNKTTFTVSGLENDAEYTFTIQTFDTSLNYSEGLSHTATVADTSDKDAPEDVTDLNIIAANGNADLTWKNPTDSDFAGVKITMTPAAGTLANPVTLDKGVNTLAVTGLTIGEEYSFTIQTFDTSLNYSDGVTQKATVADTSDKIAPEDVTDFSVSCVNGANGKVNAILIWTDPDDDDLFGMEVTYAEDSNSRAAIAPMADGSIFVAPGKGGAVINDLTAGTTYTFTVKAMDTNGNKSDGVSTTETMSLTQLSELEITLTPSTTESTNQAVIVSVDVETPGTVSEIYYLNDEYESYDITSEASFTVEENGYFVVMVLDYDGRSNYSSIYIDNIDKTAPEAPINLATTYNYSKKTITVTWDSSDSDVDHYLVSYTKAGTEVVKDEKVTEKTYTVSSVEVGTTEEEYEFTVKVVDKASNTGSEDTASVTPKGPFVSKIELSKTRFAYTEGGSEFTATVSGSNFDLISSQSDTTVNVQIVDSDDNVMAEQEATVDAENNKATATLSLPTLSSATTDGTTYTVRVKLCGTADKEHTTTFNISDVAKVSSVTLTTTQISVNDVTSTTKTTATVKGTNFDVAGTIALALYDSTGAEYGDSVTVDSAEFTQSTTSFKVELSVPTLDDTYTVKVLFADVAQSTTASLQVYGVPAFTSFKIPNAGTSKSGNTVTATVIGKNFKAPDVSTTDFTLSCTSNSDIVSDSEVTIVSDTELTVSLTIPGTAGSYDVTIQSGSNCTTGTFTVKDYSSYAVGDIILADGTNVAVANYASDDTNKPVAVVAGFNANGVAIGLGLKKSSSLQWAPNNTTGYNTKFTDIIAKYSGNSSSGYTFTGDCDGSDNWEYICSVDPEGSAKASENYPAFNFAANYGTSQGYTGDLATGWYIPSISELYEIYKNKETLQTSLTKVSGFTIGTNYYWSSSQSSDDYNYAYELLFSLGYVDGYYKNIVNHVLVVRAF